MLSGWIKALRISTCVCKQGVEKPGEQRSERRGQGMACALGLGSNGRRQPSQEILGGRRVPEGTRSITLLLLKPPLFS